ncbi:37S ribosomal protein S10, mitochondrial [Schizosaccharomyces pombe]
MKRYMFGTLPRVQPKRCFQTAMGKESPKGNSEKDQLFENPFFQQLPSNVAAVYLNPVNFNPSENDVLCASLKIKSFETPKLDTFTDFICRTAYYMKIPIKGPRPLPNKVESWTLLRSPFIHKSSQENFERITHSRLIQLYSVNPVTLETFFSYLRKCNMWDLKLQAKAYEYESIDDALKNFESQSKSTDNFKELLNGPSKKDIITQNAEKLLRNDPIYKDLLKNSSQK